MEYKKRLRSVVWAALITAFLIIVLRRLPLSDLARNAGIGRTLSFLLVYGLLFLVDMIGAVPGMLLMKHFKTPHFIAVSLFALAESFWLSYLLIPFAIVSLVYTFGCITHTLLCVSRSFL